MSNKRASLGLQIVTLIASTPRHMTITAEALASAASVSVSYVEGILKDARESGQIQSSRGPGGGYQLAVPLESLSVWDVVKCFTPMKSSEHNAQFSSEWLTTNSVALSAHQFEREFLENYPFEKLVPKWSQSASTKPIKSLAMNFKPLPQSISPIAPNSVFDLSNFLNLQAAW